jgi:succinate dehydrogenase / fumarate reductase, cytochrome b subunit
MGWFTSTLNSSIGKKLIMSLAGLFLITFLLVHLGINLLVLKGDNTWFNIAAHFMAVNLVVKVFEVVLFAGFIIHIIYALILQIQNWLARPVRYKVENLTNQTSFFSKYMIHTAVVIFIFLVIHLADFYFKSKLYGPIGWDPVANTPDMASLVEAKFRIPGFVILYVVAFIILGFHLSHGFQSAFQTLGLNHNKYTSFIKALGLLYSIIVPLGFALVALLIYF